MPATELLTEALTFARQRMLPIEESWSVKRNMIHPHCILRRSSGVRNLPVSNSGCISYCQKFFTVFFTLHAHARAVPWNRSKLSASRSELIIHNSTARLYSLGPTFVLENSPQSVYKWTNKQTERHDIVNIVLVSYFGRFGFEFSRPERTKQKFWQLGLYVQRKKLTEHRENKTYN